MIELDHFLQYCDNQYRNSMPCQCRALCTNSNYCQGTQSNCYACIKRVHSYRNKTVHYNCDKLVNYYVLKHTYRFGAEVFFEFNRIRNDISNWQEIYITSIGCGPCSELFGSLSFWRTLGKSDSDYHFRGFDTVQLWMPILNRVNTCFPNADVHAENQDAFAYYGISQERVDVIVLNYMLSDMKKFNGAQYPNFLANLISLIRLKRPQYLLINDIYLCISLAASKELIAALKGSGMHYRGIALQYHYYNPSIGQWGHKIDKQPFAMTDAAIVQKYNPFPEVNSIQTIIKFL